MREFEYVRAADSQTALQQALGQDRVRYLAGGTNLVDLMKLGVERPELLVDLQSATGDDVEIDADGIRVSAGARNSDLAANSALRARFPAISQALLSAASGQLRNMATVGGNLLQRTRCMYFTDVTKPCNRRDPGSGCPAREGEHHNLAILGGSTHCIATHPSDFAVALVAFDAVVDVLDSSGARRIPLAELYRLPGETPEVETVLERNALITGITIPALDFARRSRYRKVRERASYAFAIGSVAAALDVVDGVVADCRIAWGAVAPTPWRARIAEAALLGQPADPEHFRAAARAELGAAEPLRDNAYKVGLIRDLTVDVLTELAAQR